MNKSVLSVKRVEHKYFITPFQSVELSNRLNASLHRDENNINDGYEIKSLYFDTFDKKDYAAKEDGAFFHEKVRIRRYNENYSYIKLENKRKYGEKQIKDSLLITADEAKMLCNRDFSFLIDRNDDVALNFYRLFSKGYRPVTIVKYKREAYYWPERNIRITIDKNPVFCETNLDFFDADLPYHNIFDVNTNILEVKYDGSLPVFVKNILGPFKSTRTSVSKYAGGRRLLINYL